jgi:hypothetical protein
VKVRAFGRKLASPFCPFRPFARYSRERQYDLRELLGLVAERNAVVLTRLRVVPLQQPPARRGAVLRRHRAKRAHRALDFAVVRRQICAHASFSC